MGGGSSKIAQEKHKHKAKETEKQPTNWAQTAPYIREIKNKYTNEIYEQV